MQKRKQEVKTEDFRLFELGREYNRKISLYENVSRNERFYRGDQWNGVNAGDLPTPVFNLFRRVINYFTATLMNQKISLKFTADGVDALFSEDGKQKLDEACELLSGYANYRFDRERMTTLLSDAILDAALTGDAFAYVCWDPTRKTSQGHTGDFVTQLVDSTNVFFGDVNTPKVEEQPYILLSGRELVSTLKEEAAACGISREEILKIRPDSDTAWGAGDMSEHELADTKATYVIKLYKKDGTVRYRKSCEGAVICPERDTGLTRYPVALMNWDRIKNSYHGQAVATGLCENQLYINKAFAMVMKHMMDHSFSKVMYNANIIDDWTNAIGEAIAVNGEVEGAALRLEPGSMQSGFLEVIHLALNLTKELMGATDAALGEVRPDNTSAIIALQQSSAIPLENQKRALYAFVEDIGIIWLDFILHYYDASRVMLYRKKDALVGGTLPTEAFQNVLFACTAEAGASSYWSELATLSTLDGLLSSGHITLAQYLDRLPDGYLPKRRELLSELTERNTEDERKQV
ncbi:MAG: hypothetical protein IKT43_00935 [Clostridia bacterium]|nr:hypothetical protein [Clostridia bacterium]